MGDKCDYYSLCISRIDFDKNINLILHANKLLDETKKIYLFGAENRLYVHHKLKDMGFEKVSHIEGGFSAIKKSKFKIV